VNDLSRWVGPRICSVRVADVRSYLSGRGWKPKPYPRPELLVFEGPLADNGAPIVQVLPAEERFADYQQRLVELVTALAVIEDRPAADVLDDILRQGAPPPNGQGQASDVEPTSKKPE
jgi:hypothetical protein